MFRGFRGSVAGVGLFGSFRLAGPAGQGAELGSAAWPTARARNAFPTAICVRSQSLIPSSRKAYFNPALVI